jgi:hypothetical protein
MIKTHQMISPLSQQLFEFVECIRFNADWLTTTFFNHTENSCLLVNLILANVDVLFDAVDWTTLEISIWIENPARVNHQIYRN